MARVSSDSARAVCCAIQRSRPCLCRCPPPRKRLDMIPRKATGRPDPSSRGVLVFSARFRSRPVHRLAIFALNRASLVEVFSRRWCILKVYEHTPRRSRSENPPPSRRRTDPHRGRSHRIRIAQLHADHPTQRDTGAEVSVVCRLCFHSDRYIPGFSERGSMNGQGSAEPTCGSTRISLTLLLAGRHFPKSRTDQGISLRTESADGT